ncbi:MAG: ABC transporter ATP-binding protein/permease [Clostridiales bacterium]|nr:ABC transporter ATP-binding protein/permease [Clostridiales bacterium]
MADKAHTPTKKRPFFGLGFLLPFWMEQKTLLALTVLTGLLGSVLEAAIPLFQRYAIDHFIGQGTLDTLTPFLLTYLLVLVVRLGINYYCTYAANKIEVVLDYSIRRKLFDHLQTLSISYYNQNGVGYIHSRLISDVGRIGAVATWSLMDLVLWDGGYLVFMLIVMLRLSWQLGLVMLALVPIEVAACAYFQRHLTTMNRRVREINSRITADYNEGITGAKTIKTLVAEEKMEDTFQADTVAMYHASVRTNHYRGTLQAIVIFAGNVGLALMLWRGGVLNMEGLLALGTLSAFTTYALSVGDVVQGIVESLQSLVSAQVNIERVERLLNTQPDVADTPEVIAKYGDSLHPRRENWEPLYGDVAFRDVTFRYPDGEETILSHFNLTVPQGTRVAIVGETGAGKSTLVNLVCRFFEPTEGAILIDGRDARERSQLWLHSNIGYVLQQPHLFSGTVLENLRYGNPDATLEEIQRACKLVCADQIIARMEHGYDSQVGEGGDLLSTGEKQLLSFARAILSDPRILVLDEATSSIDTLTEQLIQSAIAEMTRGRTSFIIAHRLSTIRDADVILMVKDGEIIERGTHQALMAARGAYYRLYTQQFTAESVSSVLH